VKDAAHQSPDSGRLLIVDDDALILDGLKILLEMEGFRVKTTLSCFELPFLIGSFHPDVILFDIFMPAMRGDKLLALVRSQCRLSGTQLILHSGLSIEELSGKTEEVGADGFLHKPTDTEQLLQRLQFWVACAWARRNGDTAVAAAECVELHVVVRSESSVPSIE
jgi:DNA-binding response OmpR family regulator